MDIFSLGAVGLITFGGTWLITLFVPNLDSKTRFGVSVAVALIAGFIPADLGNVIVNKVRDAFGIAVAVAGGYQLIVKTADRINTKS